MDEEDVNLKRVYAHQNAELDKRAYFTRILFFFLSASFSRTKEKETQQKTRVRISSSSSSSSSSISVIVIRFTRFEREEARIER
jgi:hypothetical protein